jgi:hypothetical protein
LFFNEFLRILTNFQRIRSESLHCTNFSVEATGSGVRIPPAPLEANTMQPIGACNGMTMNDTAEQPTAALPLVEDKPNACQASTPSDFYKENTC